jgi:hypothetical protein
MVDSLENNRLGTDHAAPWDAADTDAIVGSNESSMNLGFPQFPGALTTMPPLNENECHLLRARAISAGGPQIIGARLDPRAPRDASFVARRDW